MREDEKKFLIVNIKGSKYEYALRTPLLKNILNNEKQLDLCMEDIKRALLNIAEEETEDINIEKLDMKAMKQDFNTVENELILGYKINEIIDFIEENK